MSAQASQGTSENPARFRPDLRIQSDLADPDLVEIEDPRNGARYQFDRQTLALFRAFDGARDCPRIAADFNARFGTSLSSEEVARFRDEALASGLIEYATEPAQSARPRGRAAQTSGREGAHPDETLDDDEARGDERWTLINPAPVFAALARALAPVRLLFLLLSLSLIGLVPLALYTLFDNQALMHQDLAWLGTSTSYFGRLLFSLLLINLLRCLVQGTLIAHFGGEARAFGIRLRFGIIPRFFIDKSAIRDFNRRAKLWTWGANLLFRLVLVAAGALIWISLRDSASSLALNALVLAHAGLIGFVLVCLPIRASDGYRWFMTWRRLPLGTLKLALHILGARLRGKPLPTSI
ncbi:MAG: hypothetical protein JXM75_03555, partial [Chromatiaceae bacterium]|nr:hypothetical protein [Chromatiaceae bacterium]